MNPASSPITPLAQVLDHRQREGQRVSFRITEDWQQGRTMFGGVLSVMAVRAMRDICGSDWPLRALQTNFVGPVSPGLVHVDVTLLRQGKNIRQVKAQILQANAEGMEQIAGILLGSFGVGRESVLPSLRPPQVAVANAVETSYPWPFIPGMTPPFTRHLEFRHAEGGTPFSGDDSWHSRTYVRLLDNAGIDTELQAIILADAGPTPALAQLRGYTPASSVSWALELRPVNIGQRDGHWRMDKDALAVGE
ncbi:MAG: thioesterase family protein, partial [Aquabacterium sp.]